MATLPYAKAFDIWNPLCAGGLASRSIRASWFPTRHSTYTCSKHSPDSPSPPTGWWNGQPGQIINHMTTPRKQGKDGDSIWFKQHRGPCRQIWNPATLFVCNLHGRCLLSLAPGNHASIYAQWTASDLSVFLEQWAWKSSNACQKMDNGKANYLGLDLSTINQMSKGKILGESSFPCWVQSKVQAALQPELQQTAHTI